MKIEKERKEHYIMKWEGGRGQMKSLGWDEKDGRRYDKWETGNCFVVAFGTK